MVASLARVQDVDKLVCAGDDGTLISYEFGGSAPVAAEHIRRAAPPALGCTPVAAMAMPGSSSRASSRPGSGPRSQGSSGGGGCGERKISAAQQYAEKKRLAMERAAAIKAERKASAGGAPPDQLDQFMGDSPGMGGGNGGGMSGMDGGMGGGMGSGRSSGMGDGMAGGMAGGMRGMGGMGGMGRMGGMDEGMGMEGGMAPPKPPSELDMLHALGDRKFGRRR